MSTNTGEMRHRIELNNPKRISDGRGGYRMDYAAGDKMTVWAGVKLLSIEQQLRYRQPEEAATTRFKIRENPFIGQDKTRITHAGAVYRILQIAPMERQPQFWEIRAREV